MDTLTLDELKELAQQTGYPRISIFLPTYRAGQDTQQGPIRFKNLLRNAEQQFLAGDMGPRDVHALLEPAQDLLDDSYFWTSQYDGLAVFLAAQDFHFYRLPFAVEEMLVIAKSYYIKPVLPLFTNNGHYYLLALSQNEVRLFEGTRDSLGQIDLPDETPGSLDEALRLDDPQKQLQFHTGTAQGGMRGAMFHGQGAGSEEEQKVWIEQYFNLVDTGLKSIFREQTSPLVLAGVDYLLPIYRKVSEYANIMEEGITGNPELLRPEELHEQAWPIVEAQFRHQTRAAVEQYRQLAGTERAAASVEQIVAAAYYGRVDRLFLSMDAQVWGTFDSATGKTVRNPHGQVRQDDLALLDFAAAETLKNGGTVYALTPGEMPVRSPAAAVLRY